MMSQFWGYFLTLSLPLVRILFTDPLLVKSKFHAPPPSPYIRTSFMDAPLSYCCKALTLTHPLVYEFMCVPF